MKDHGRIETRNIRVVRIFRRLAMNMAAIADPERRMASIRRAAAFGAGYLKGILGKIFLKKDIKSF